MSNDTRDLNERSLQLLKTLVERYISDGQPVGSRVLSKDMDINLSPATIRNVMADLEDLGLIHSPHTSAGRIPTVSGYRLFVDSLLTVKPLDSKDISRLHQGLSERDSDGNMIGIASRLLAGVLLEGSLHLSRRRVVPGPHGARGFVLEGGVHRALPRSIARKSSAGSARTSSGVGGTMPRATNSAPRLVNSPVVFGRSDPGFSTGSSRRSFPLFFSIEKGDTGSGASVCHAFAIGLP